MRIQSQAALALVAPMFFVGVVDAQRAALPEEPFVPGKPGVDWPYIPPPGMTENAPSFPRSVDWRTGAKDGVRVLAETLPDSDRASVELGDLDEFLIASQTIIEDPGATWLRVQFAQYELGAASFVRVHSLKDGQSQDLDARAMESWYGYSAFFEGEALLLELHVAPEDEGVFVEVETYLAGNPFHENVWVDRNPEEDTLCGADNRVASADSRVGRIRRADGLVFCSPWLATNGAALMAGHCFDNDNNGTNELVTAGSVMEFNPPASTSWGAPNPSTAVNQYPVDMTQLNWSPSPYAIGSDWAVFGLNPNAGNNIRAHIARGYYRMSRSNPSSGNTIRITGCGDDSTPAGTTGGLNAQSQTLQTSTGPYAGEFSSGSRIWHRYSTDTTNNSSGSPIIWNTWATSIGIHTNAGCTATGGSNQGVSFEHNALETGARDFVGTTAVFVDRGFPNITTAEDGTVFLPYDTIAEGVNKVSSGGTLSLVEGTYSPASGGTYTISKAMTIEAPVGTVTLND